VGGRTGRRSEGGRELEADLVGEHVDLGIHGGQPLQHIEHLNCGGVICRLVSNRRDGPFGGGLVDRIVEAAEIAAERGGARPVQQAAGELLAEDRIGRQGPERLGDRRGVEVAGGEGRLERRGAGAEPAVEAERL
jgi:hypothetical protein